MLPDVIITGTVVKGHRVASGANRNPLFPGGTLAMQTPFFKRLGLDLSGFHPATINVSIAPYDFAITDPDWHFEKVAWHPTEPPEDFSFVGIEVFPFATGTSLRGLIYYPHPETKPAHHQPGGIVEILLERFVEELTYGATVRLGIPDAKVRLSGP